MMEDEMEKVSERNRAEQGPTDGVAPYLTIGDKRAAAAVTFYEKAFGAKAMARMPADDGRLMHCCIGLNGGWLMLSDAFPEHGHPAKPPAGFALHLQVDDADKWWSRALAAGCEVVMPIAQQFWGDRYGQLRDPFGVVWSIGSTPKG
jgi:PhnB protein